MTWLILTIVASLFVSLGGIADRYILKHDTSHPEILTAIWGLVSLFIFCSPAIYHQQINFSPLISIGGLAIGIIYLLSMYSYYASVAKAEISRVIPILSINPILVLIMATFLFQEIFHPLQYLGMFIIIIGVIIVSYHGKDKHALPRQAFLLVALAACGFAIKNIITKGISINQTDNYNLIFWIGIGIGITSIFFFLKQKKSLLKISNKKFFHYFVTSSLNSFGSLFFTLAVTIGPVALITFLSRIDILFVFIIAEALDYLRPNILKEKLNKNIFFQKLISVILILIGSFLLI